MLPSGLLSTTNDEGDEMPSTATAKQRELLGELYRERTWPSNEAFLNFYRVINLHDLKSQQASALISAALALPKRRETS